MSVISLSSGDEEDCMIVESENEETSLEDTHKIFIVESYTHKELQVGHTTFPQNSDVVLDSDSSNKDSYSPFETNKPHIEDGRDKETISYELEPNICPSVPDNNFEVVILPCQNSEEIINSTSNQVVNNSNTKGYCTVEYHLSHKAKVEENVNKCNIFENTVTVNTQHAASQSKLQRLAKLLATALTNNDLPNTPTVNNVHLNYPNSSSNTRLEVPKCKTLSNIEKTILEVSKGNFSSAESSIKGGKRKTADRERGRWRSSSFNDININCDTSGINSKISIQNISFQTEGFLENANLVQKASNILEQTDMDRKEENVEHNNNLLGFPKAVAHGINLETSTKGRKRCKSTQGRKMKLIKYSEIETSEVLSKQNNEERVQNRRTKKAKKKTSIIGRPRKMSAQCLTETLGKQNTSSKATTNSELKNTEALFNGTTIITDTIPGDVSAAGNDNTVQSITIHEDVRPCSQENDCTVENNNSKEYFNSFESGSSHDKELQSIIENLSVDIYVSLASSKPPSRNNMIQDEKNPLSRSTSKDLICSDSYSRNSKSKTRSDEVSVQTSTDHGEQMCSQSEEENTSLPIEIANSDLSADEQLRVRNNFVKCYGIIFNENIEEMCIKMGDLLLLSLKESRNYKTRLTKASKLTCKNLKNTETSIAKVCYQDTLKKYRDAFSISFIKIHKSIFKNKVIGENYPEQYKALLLAWFLKLILRLTFLCPEFLDCFEEIKINMTTCLLDDESLQLLFVHDVFTRNSLEFERECWLVLDFMKDCTTHRDSDTQSCLGDIANAEQINSSTISTSDTVLPLTDSLHLVNHNLSEQKALSNVIDHTTDKLCFDNKKKDLSVKTLPERIPEEDSNLKPRGNANVGEKELSDEVNNELVIQKNNVMHHSGPQQPPPQTKHDINRETESFDVQRKSILMNHLLVRNDLFPSNRDNVIAKRPSDKDGQLSKDTTDATGEREVFSSVIRTTSEGASKNSEKTSLAKITPLPSTLDTLRNKPDQAPHTHVPITLANHSSLTSLTVETCKYKNSNPQSYLPVNYSTIGTPGEQPSTMQSRIPVSCAIVQPIKRTEDVSYSHAQEAQPALVVSRNNHSMSNYHVPAHYSTQNSVGTINQMPYGTGKTNTQSNTLTCKPTNELVQLKVVPSSHNPQLLYPRLLDSVPQSNNQHYITRNDGQSAFSNNGLTNCEIIRNEHQNIHPDRMYQNVRQGGPRCVLVPNSTASTQFISNFYNERSGHLTPNVNIGRLQPQTRFNSYQYPVNNRSSQPLYYKPPAPYPSNRAVNGYQTMDQQNVAQYNVLQQQSYTNHLYNSHYLTNPSFNSHRMSYPQYFNAVKNRVVDSSQIQAPLNLTQNITDGSEVTINNYNINMHNPLGYPAQFNHPYSVGTANTFRQVVPTQPNLSSKETVAYRDASRTQQIVSLQPSSSDVMQPLTNMTVSNTRMN